MLKILIDLSDEVYSGRGTADSSEETTMESASQPRAHRDGKNHWIITSGDRAIGYLSKIPAARSLRWLATRSEYRDGLLCSVDSQAFKSAPEAIQFMTAVESVLESGE